MRKDGKGEGQAPRGGGVSAPCRVDKSVDRSRIGGNAKGRSPWKMKSVSASVPEHRSTGACLTASSRLHASRITVPPILDTLATNATP